MGWKDTKTIPSTSFTCGYCSNNVAPNQGYINEYDKWKRYIHICHFCNKPTYIDKNRNQYPGAPFGIKVNNLPSEVEQLYEEARSCTSCNAYTAAVLCSRKLLMNVAVSKGAQEGLKFIDYVEFLSNKNYIPPDGKEWVDYIRNKGNEATHEIAIMTKEDAQQIIIFIEMLLRFVYEFPSYIKKES